jgi:acylphosphatase
VSPSGDSQRPRDRDARLTARVRGSVQGVGFRFFARRTALSLGLRGYVRNLADGSVEALAEGPGADLETLLSALRRGPAGARVDDVEARWSEPSSAFSGFAIRY